MAARTGKVTARVIRDGLLGAPLGMLVGGFVGPLIAPSDNDLLQILDHFVHDFDIGALSNDSAGLFGQIVAEAACAILGALGGVALGAALAKGRCRTKDAATPANG